MESDYLLNPLSKQLMGEARHQFAASNLLINQKWNKSAQRKQKGILVLGGGRDKAILFVMHFLKVWETRGFFFLHSLPVCLLHTFCCFLIKTFLPSFSPSSS